MIRTLDVLKDSSYGTASMLPGILASAKWKCDVLQTMLLIGYLTSPPRYNGFHLSTFWAWLRYSAAISQRTSELRLRKIWSEMDPHQKTILADDFGMGFTCHYLVDQHAFEDFADTTFLLKTLLGSLTSHIVIPKRGAAKSPDFIAVDSNSALHILECKGSQSSHTYLKTAMGKGLDQKNNLSNGTVFKSCMVGGTFVPLDKNPEEARIVFIDPDPSKLFEKLKEVAPEKIVSAVRRQSFAKSLTAAGLWRSATVLYDGEANANDVLFVKNLIDGELQFAGFEKAGGNWVKKINYRSFEQKDDAGYDEAYQTSLTIRVPELIPEFFKFALDSKGMVAENEVDTWIASNVKTRREEKNSSVLGKKNGDEKQSNSVRRTFESSWRTKEIDSNTSTVTTTSGIQLELNRAKF